MTKKKLRLIFLAMVVTVTTALGSPAMAVDSKICKTVFGSAGAVVGGATGLLIDVMTAGTSAETGTGMKVGSAAVGAAATGSAFGSKGGLLAGAAL